MTNPQATTGEENYHMSNAELAQAIKDINHQRANSWHTTAVIFQKHLQDLLDEQGRRAAERISNA